ncbi:PREDICTED: uncharacterized protein LOC105366378 [Ceratosolen solmsi marchali]|uniref:Uncharacterized protein LOC105366378 n=1 Tax=Ceratosolen solmsi marchali TaxID=326594 RepID=A0AAJ7E0E6_9HYME|nr:PREDICTED: uncharacterized protein LOC105366378 [Ceratosolen solmsi marchali]
MTMSCCDGFRLPAPSECSLRSKARIDALFEETQSVCSSSLAGGGWCTAGGAVAGDDPRRCYREEDQQRRVNSAVQARIEAMFASVEAENVGECAAAVLPVKYMGAAPVGGRVASVRGLQEPLRQLAERIDESVSAELEISRRGLTFRANDLHEKNNPFRRIAVWSALKLQTRRRHNSLSQEVVHAFVPLVSEERDPSASTTNSEDRHADLYRTMRGLAKDVEDYPPIFAVVMRRPGAARLLECHAFACRCEEDAIAAAATLYRALLADLDATARRPRQRNGLGCASLASVVSSVPDNSSVLTTKRLELQRPKLPPPPFPPPLPSSNRQPVRPPRSKKSSPTSSSASIGEKPSRMDKNNSVVSKTEDVTEAHSRRLGSQSGNNNEVEAKERHPDNNASLRTSSHPKETSEERRMNAKNKMYGSRSSRCRGTEAIEAPVIEKIYEQRKFRDGHVVDDPYDENEKSSSDHERCGSYNFNCCTENSLYESSRIYAEVHSVSSKPMSEQRLPMSSSSRGQSLSGCRGEAYEDTGRKRSLASRYSHHFRNAEKIYQLGQRDQLPSDDRIYDTACTTRQASQGPRYGAGNRSTRSSRRPGRVSTLDRPLRRGELEAQRQPQQVQPQCFPMQERRRNRAGSEPPNSRTEAAAAAAAAHLRRSQSELDLDRGDLMTRVELPRHGSFLKPGSVRKRESLEGGGAGTPLGFTELFDEFRNQEGLTSVDDILAAIIDPEGMSFNDLKPLYKEFLLKLAATLTQDELYERSASIMRRRRRPQRRRSSRGGGAGGACLLRRAIKRSVSRLKSVGSGPTEFTSVVYPARRLNNERASLGSTSSREASAGCRTADAPSQRQRAARILAGKLGRSRSAKRCASSKSRPGHTTSEDSDTCRRMSRAATTANRSSSGYVSCSECSYDSESCTCISADKCYCSLSRKAPEEVVGPTICGCDTDSCSDSNKCYCSRERTAAGPSILEQLRQKGILPAESTISRAGSPDRQFGKSLVTSKSLEYLKVRPSSPEEKRDNLGLDYDLFAPGRASRCSSGSEKVLVVSARDPRGRIIYVGGTDRDDGLPLRGCQGEARRGISGSGGDHEALSIKKTAEIAAVFAGQRKIGRRASSTSSLKSSISLEAGLGYLP